MNPVTLPAESELFIQFAHSYFNFSDTMSDFNLGISYAQSFSYDDTLKSISNADIAVLSGFWNPELLDHAPRLKLIHVPAAGYDNFDLSELRDRGIALTNSRGAMANAVAEHAIALILSFTRMLPTLRDFQLNHQWRPPIKNSRMREEELDGKTVLVFGLGTIGSRFAVLAKAFNMYVIGIKRNVVDCNSSVDEMHAPEMFEKLLPGADFVVLTCPLNSQTEGLINRKTLKLMRKQAVLVNVARGRCVIEEDLINSLRQNEIAGACLDCAEQEPLSAESELWEMSNVIVTPHSAGDTRRYEENVVKILIANIRNIQNGRALENQIV